MTGPEEGKKKVIKVRLLRAGEVIRSYKVRSDTFTIGSGEGCTIRVAGDSSLEPKHATIYVEEGELTLVPEPGAKVLLNGESVDFAVPRVDDIIKAGRLTFRVELTESMDSIAPQNKKELDNTLEHLIPPPAREKAKGTVRRRSSVPPAERSSRSPEKKRIDLASITPKLESLIPPKPSVTPSRPSARALRKAHRKRSLKPLPKEIIEQPQEIVSFLEEDTFTKMAPKDRADEPPIMDLPDEYEFLTDGYPSETSVKKLSPIEDKKAPEPLPEAAQDIEFDEDYYSSDDDDDEFCFEEPFSLADHFFERKDSLQKVPKESYCSAHVVRVVGGRVAETFGVLPGVPYVSSNGELECRISRRRLSLKGRSGMNGDLWKQGQKLDFSTITTKKDTHRAVLGEGDFALLSGNEGTYKVEVYRPPRAPRPGTLRASPRFILIVVLALVVHAVVSGAVAYFQPKIKQRIVESENEVFAVVKMDKPEFNKPEQKIKKKKPRRKDTLSMSERAPAVSRRTIKRIRARATTSQTTSSVNSLLNVLSKGSGKAGASDKLKDLVSNIDAVAPSSGSGSAFSIAGAIASLPGEGVNIARKGGGGAISTMSGEEVAGKGSGIANLARGKRSGKIRGKVTKLTSGAKVKGSLSRAEISRVVNSHIHAIQACYERALMNKPGISGRIVFDWTVTKAGRVKGVRVRSSTLGSTKVAGCISSLIKRWKFPRPKGGEVIVTFPFLFRSVSS